VHPDDMAVNLAADHEPINAASERPQQARERRLPGGQREVGGGSGPWGFGQRSSPSTRLISAPMARSRSSIRS
jgi:hypothetical protein